MDCIDHGKRGNHFGYATTTRTVGGKRRAGIKLHRLVYCEAHGLSLLDIEGQVVRHTCDNPRCINPDHMVLGTHQDNVADRVARGRGAVGEKNGRAVLCPAVVDAIRSRYANGGIKQSELAEIYGVSQTQVSRIVRGESWGS